ncbi:ABZJ_00895 family protein [Bosea sp. NPDC003192]|uniref:ABZJ_00895 family protein n=1 Tax=Bosea sp. NPDC003192 TaxID=3390551 RepID=UPI003D0269AD
MPQQPTASPMSTGALVLRYAGFLIVGVVLLNVVFLLLERYFTFSTGNMAAMGLFLIWGAASWVGQLWFLREQARPASGRAWTVAALCALVTYAVQAAFVFLAAAALLSEFGTLGLGRGSDRMIILGVFAAVAVLELLVIRLAIGIGAKGAEKRAQRQAAKAGA